MVLGVFRAAVRRAREVYRFSDRFDRYEMIVNTASLSPVDRHIAMHMASHKHAVYAISYARWRVKRINMMLKLLGADWFAGKRILELGAGLSDIGAFFADLGADVVCVEGREETANFARLKHRKVEGIKVEVFDLEQDFSHLGRFDLIIHFGLLYHIPDVEAHLARCFAMCDEMFLETVVCDSDDPYKLELVPERSDVIEEAMHGMGSRPSAAYVERVARENGFEPQMIKSAELNVGDQFVYDWEPKHDGDLGGWRNRRFWRLSRSTMTNGSAPAIA